MNLPVVKFHPEKPTETGQVPNKLVLRTSKLEIGYRDKRLLPPIEISVNSGEFWAIVGPNGGGKTTCLKTLSGLLSPISGAFQWSEASRLGYVPQRSSIDLGMPVRVVDLVRSGLDRGNSFLIPGYVWFKRQEVHKAMKDTSISELAGQQISQLSEGQKQRVFVARALVTRPSVLLLDEPTSAMDVEAESRVYELLESLKQNRNLTMVLVSHHLALVARYATHILMLDKDRDFLMAGSVEEVARHGDILSRFGTVLKDALRHRFGLER